MKELNSREIAAVKRQYKNSLSVLKQIESLNKKIADLINERDQKEEYLNALESGIKHLTGGYRSIDLIQCEYVPQFNEDGTPKMDKEGKYQIKTQVLTYVPVIETPEEPAVFGNDFDLDFENLKENNNEL